MCGRFNIISDPLTRFLLEITGQRLSLKDQYNIAPTEDIPASGYYEWKKEGYYKIPYYITPINEESHLSAEHHSTGLLFAGLWDIWEKEGRVIESCSLITTAATDSMSKIHARMPVMLNKNEAHSWIDKASDRKTLRGILNARLKIQLEATPVSDWVNSARHKDSRCVIPAGESRAINN